MIYELAKLDMKLWGTLKAPQGIADAMSAPGTPGTFLGCWDIDIGTLGRLLLLRGFNDEAELAQDSKRRLSGDDPFGAGQFLSGFSTQTYAPFAFTTAIAPGAYGRVYEFREYDLAVGGIPPTVEAWRAAWPARQTISPVLAVMHAADSTPHMLHIIAYPSLDVRDTLRAQIYGQGLWPPKGAPEQIVAGTSTIARPTPQSLLR